MNKIENVAQIGLDCHRTFSQVTAREANGKIAWRERLNHRDRVRMRERLRAWPVGTPVILEGTFGWGWMSDELVAAGQDPHLASSRKVAAWREARGMAKTNTIDADLLSELWKEQNPRWWEVWLAPPEVRDRREWLRHRMALVRMQTGIKNRIHATLHRHGVLHEHADLFGVAGRRFLSLLVTDEQAMRESGRETLKEQLILLDQVRRLIGQATSEFRRSLGRCEQASRLKTLPGVSHILGYTIWSEIGRIERFKGSRKLSRYSLLAPAADDSGEEDRGTPIGRRLGHAGRQTLQWAWIEAAHGAVIKDARMRAIFNRRTDNGKRDRGRGYIAVAHELCRIGYSMLKRGVDYSENRPVRPGTQESKPSGDHRPGTGQPEAAMAAAVQ